MLDKLRRLSPFAKTMTDSNVVTASKSIREYSLSLVFELDK